MVLAEDDAALARTRALSPCHGFGTGLFMGGLALPVRGVFLTWLRIRSRNLLRCRDMAARPQDSTTP